MRTIRSRLSILTSVAVIISVVAIGFVSVQFIKNIYSDDSDKLLKMTCERNQQKINSYFGSIEQCVDMVSLYAENEISGLSDEDLAKYLADVDELFRSAVFSTNGIITYYFRIDPALSKKETGFWYSRVVGETFTSDEPTDISKYDPDDMEHVGWFYLPKKQGSAMWLDPYVNENLNNTKMISYVAPVYSRGRFIGVIGIDYDYKTLCRAVEYRGPFSSGYEFLADKNDNIIYHPTVESGTPLGELSEELEEDNLSGSEQIISFASNGELQRASWSKLSNGMKLYYAVSEREIRSLWYELAGYFAMIAIGILFLFMFISLLMANRITKPLSDLTEAARRVDEGDYDIDFDYNGVDEIAVLAGTFRQLTDHLSVYINDLNDRAYKDALTSVRNKAAFDMYMRKLDDRIKASAEGEKPEFAICMFDCNGLKLINDTFGHDKGDFFLKRACSLICDVFKHSPVFRLGGDEFTCILQNEDYASRLELCREFERRCEEISECAEEPWEKVDIANGISKFMYPRDENTGTVLKRADQRMYEDKSRKKAGLRNRLLEDDLFDDNLSVEDL